jgi:ATP-dependent DNA helicase PIF1
MLDGILFDKLVGCENLAFYHGSDSFIRNISLDLYVIARDPSVVSRYEHNLCHDSLLPTVLQLVICGDFFQLPPVPDQSHNHKMPATFAFDAQSWSICISKPIFLTQVFRQKDNSTITFDFYPLIEC